MLFNIEKRQIANYFNIGQTFHANIVNVKKYEDTNDTTQFYFAVKYLTQRKNNTNLTDFNEE